MGIVWYLQKEDSRPHWSFCGMVQELNFPTRGLFNKQRSLDCALFCCKTRRKRLKHERSVRRNTRRVECSSRFLSALQQNRAQSRLLYLFYNKESVKFPKQTPKPLLSIFKTNFISKANNRVSACSVKIPVRMVQII